MFENRIIGSGTEKPDQLLANPFNWRIHPRQQQQALTDILGDVGWVQNVIVNQRTGHVVDGHMRVGVAISENQAEIPVVYVDLDEEEEQKILASLDPIGSMAVTDTEQLQGLISGLAFGDALDEVLSDVSGERSIQAALDSLNDKELKPGTRTTPIDAITTVADTPKCCIAVACGLQIGIQSKGTLTPEKLQPCLNAHRWPNHAIKFVDNDYFNYIHAKHLNDVQAARPKYATVKDIMTETQCAQAGIEYTPLEQILEWGEELAEHAENVIMIPKYDCMDKIPEKFMLGYSIPTTHGGTPLAIDAFQGRRVHLLGGSWKQQIAGLNALGEDVVSLDINQTLVIAKWAQFFRDDGAVEQITEVIPNQLLTAPLLICYILSCSAVAAGLKRMMGEEVKAESITDEIPRRDQ